MNSRQYITRVLFPVLAVLTFCVCYLFFLKIDGKDRALVLILITHLYALTVFSGIWLLFRLMNRIWESLNINIVSIIFIAVGFFYLFRATDKIDFITSFVFISANLVAIFFTGKKIKISFRRR